MHSRTEFLIRGTSAAAFAVIAGARALYAQGGMAEIIGATAITRVFGEGQTLVAVALEYSDSHLKGALDGFSGIRIKAAISYEHR